MCRNVIIHEPNGSVKICKTQLELLSEMPNGIINYDNEMVRNSCLCPTDINLTAVTNGFVASWYDEKDEYDPFDMHFYRIQD